VESWTDLALRARNGDGRDFEAFVNEAYGPTRRLCASLVDEASADDLVQETFLRAAKGIRRFRGASSARTWLFSIAHHVCASELHGRITRRGRSVLFGDIEVNDTRTIQDLAENIAITDLLQYLTPERRSSFVLTQLYGISYEEAATICQCAEGTVASRVARARRDLISLFHVDVEPQDVARDSAE
jgi:RNA polymerase sigma-70 factor (ECF subfamily)